MTEGSAVTTPPVRRRCRGHTEAPAANSQSTTAAADPPIAYALPGVHEAARRLISKIPPAGRLIDLGAGQGALSHWAREQGFQVTATELDADGFKAQGVPCLAVDLNGPLPMENDSADVVVALEVIEHLENQYAFLREIARVTRPGGHVVLSTPNEANVQNRWCYFWTGFYGDSRHVIDHNDPELPMRHINMIPPAQLELAWRRAGLELVDVEVSKYRATSWLLLPLVYPIQRFRLALRLWKIKDPAERALSRRVYNLLNDVRMLAGRVVAYHLRKTDG